MPRPREFDTDVALKSAMGCFWRQGYGATTPAQLEASTGLGRGSLYNAFGSKHALFVAALRRYVATESARLTAVLDGPGGARDRLRAALALVADAAAADTDGRGCLITATASELGRADPEAAAIVGELLTAQRTAFAAVISAGQTAGELRGGVSPAAAADFLLTTTNGLRALARSGAAVADPHTVAHLALRALEKE